MALIIDFVVGELDHDLQHTTNIFVNGKPVTKCSMVNIDGVYRVFNVTDIRAITDIVDSGILNMKYCLERAIVKFRVTIFGTTLPFVYLGNDDDRYYYVATNADGSIVVEMSIGIEINRISVYSGKSSSDVCYGFITKMITNEPAYDIANGMANMDITNEMANMDTTNEAVYDIANGMANMDITSPLNFIYINPRCITINFTPTPNGYSLGSIMSGRVLIECSFKTELDGSWTLSSNVITPINSNMLELNVLDFDNIVFYYDNCRFEYKSKWIYNGKTYYQINIDLRDIQICLFVNLDDGYIRFYPAY